MTCFMAAKQMTDQTRALSEENINLIQEFECMFVQLAAGVVRSVLIDNHFQVEPSLDFLTKLVDFSAEAPPTQQKPPVPRIGRMGLDFLDHNESYYKQSPIQTKYDSDSDSSAASSLGHISSVPDRSSTRSTATTTTTDSEGWSYYQFKDRLFDYFIDNLVVEVIESALNEIYKEAKEKQLFEIETESEMDALKRRLKSNKKVLVLIRGLPGSGKSHLAMELWNASGSKGIIFSADDFFMKYGVYVFEADKLGEAHEWNKKRAFEAMSDQNLSPIIIDNTNMEAWEMLPYVKVALSYNFTVEMVEPNTPWRYSIPQCFKKNSHGVPKVNIERMLDRFDRRLTKEMLIAMADNKGGAKPKTNHNRATTVSPLKNKPKPPPPLIERKAPQNENLFNNYYSAPKTNLKLHSTNQNQNSFDYFIDSHSKEYDKYHFKSSDNSGDSVVDTLFDDILKPPPEKRSSEWLVGDDWNVPTKEAQLSNGLVTQDFSVPRKSRLAAGINWSIPGYPPSETSPLTNRASDLSPKAAMNNSATQTSSDTHSDDRLLTPRHRVDSFEGLPVNCNGISTSTMTDECVLLRPSGEKLLKLFSDVTLSIAMNTLEICEGDIDLACNTLMDEGYELRWNLDGSSGEASGDSGVNDRVVEEITTMVNKPERIEHLMDVKCVAEGKDKDVSESFQSLKITEVDTSADLGDDLMMTLHPRLAHTLHLLFSPTDDPCPPSDQPFVIDYDLARRLYDAWMGKRGEATKRVESPKESGRGRNLEQFCASSVNVSAITALDCPKNLKDIMELEKVLLNSSFDGQETNDVASCTSTKLKISNLKEFFPLLTESVIIKRLAENEYDSERCAMELISFPECTNEPKHVTYGNSIVYQSSDSGTSSPVRHDSGVSIPTSSPVRPIPSKEFDIEDVDFTQFLQDPDFNDLRAEARRHNDLRKDFQRRAVEARNSNLAEAATYFNDQARLHKVLLEETNLKASELILVAKNGHRDGNALDLHLLHVPEAIRTLSEYIRGKREEFDRECDGLRRQKRKLAVITGWGKTTGGKPRLKPAVETYLKQRNIEYREVNRGMMEFYL